MARDLIRKLSDFAVQYGIALFLGAILLGQVVNPMLDQGLQDLKTTATNYNYTSSASAVDTAGNLIDTGVFLIFLSFLVEPILVFTGRRTGSASGYIAKVVTFSIALLFTTIFVFQLGLPEIIKAGLLNDAQTAAVIIIVGAGYVLAGTGLLAYEVIKVRRARETSVIRIA